MCGARPGKGRLMEAIFLSQSTGDNDGHRKGAPTIPVGTAWPRYAPSTNKARKQVPPLGSPYLPSPGLRLDMKFGDYVGNKIEWSRSC